MKLAARIFLGLGIVLVMQLVLLAAVCWEILHMADPLSLFNRGIIAMQGFSTAVCMAFLFTDIVKPQRETNKKH